MMLTSAFTCTGPYAILIMLGIKRVENRSACPMPERGRCAVWCSKSFSREEFGNFVQWSSRSLSEDDFAHIPSWSDVASWPGTIVGACDYACREGSDEEPWDEGYQYWWDLSEVVAFESPIPCRGTVGMWHMPSTLAAQVTAADMRARLVGEKISSAADAAQMFRMAVAIAGMNEGFFVLPLDRERRVLSEPVLVSLGTVSTATINPGSVVSVALKTEANAIIVAHNHPSGNLTPSKADMALTIELKDLCARLEIDFLDHLILDSSGNSEGQGFASVAERS